MNVAEYTTQNIALANWVWVGQKETSVEVDHTLDLQAPKKGFDLLEPFRKWLDGVEVRDRQRAHHLCQLIPSQCPFERDVKLFGRTLFHIPPLCKLNPLYEELVALRFRALCYLADECGEDISAYC